MKLPVKGLPLPVRLIFDSPLTDEELLELSAGNNVVWIEREASGALYAKPIGGALNGVLSAQIGSDLKRWSVRAGRRPDRRLRTGSRSRLEGTMMSRIRPV